MLLSFKFTFIVSSSLLNLTIFLQVLMLLSEKIDKNARRALA